MVGAIDGTHIRIKTPKESGADYFSRLQKHDVVVQAVADGNERFLDVAAGFSGSMHNSRVLRDSSLYGRITNNKVSSSYFFLFLGLPPIFSRNS